MVGDRGGRAAYETDAGGGRDATVGVHIVGSGFPLTAALGHAPSTSFEFEWLALDAEGGPYLFVVARGGDPTRARSALDRDPTVRSVDLFEEEPDRRLYRVGLSGAAATLLEECTHNGLVPSSVESTRSGWLATLSTADADVDALADLCEEWPIDVERPSGPDPHYRVDPADG